MKRYAVHFKQNKATKFYLALSYTENEEKYFFHKSEDQSDKDSFAFKKDVAGIDVQEEGTPRQVID